MRIIVSGGAGFIGSHIAETYIKDRHSVVIIDNLSTGSRRNLPRQAKFYKVDILDNKKIDLIFRKERPEIVNHQAARIAVAESYTNPLPTLQTNVEGSRNLVASFINHRGHHNKNKFIFASSGGAIYGETKLIPTPENAPAKPISPYGLSKLLTEKYLNYLGRTKNLSYLILRYANVYGPRQIAQNEGGVVAIFGNCLKQGKSATIFGDGTKTRDYVHVTDIARANLLALSRGHNIALNIGTGIQTPDQKVFDTILSVLKVSASPSYAPIRPGEINKSAVAIGQAKKLLNWQPRIAFAQGISTTLTTL